MHQALTEMLCCPACHHALQLHVDRVDAFGIEEGTLSCAGCAAVYPVTNHIPRFVQTQSYADNFGYQWTRHRRTQIDAFSGTSASRDRFFEVTRWEQDLGGQKILEPGCGAGRFTHIALKTGAEVYSVDISSAVDADWENNKDNPRCHIVQADINALPFKPGIFDKAFCLGVLQHCPDPRQAFLSMVKHVKPGGSLAIDIYRSKPRDLVNPLNGMRLLTTRMDVASLYKMVTKYVPILFPVKQFIVDKWPLGRHIGFFIPVIYHKWIVPGGAALPQTTLLEWSILDTYDALAAKYDKPQTIKRIRGWCAEASLTSIEVEKGFNGINARGVVAETRRPQIP